MVFINCCYFKIKNYRFLTNISITKYEIKVSVDKDIIKFKFIFSDQNGRFVHNKFVLNCMCIVCVMY